jgi:hypothetical protein
MLPDDYKSRARKTTKLFGIPMAKVSMGGMFGLIGFSRLARWHAPGAPAVHAAV